MQAVQGQPQGAGFRRQIGHGRRHLADLALAFAGGLMAGAGAGGGVLHLHRHIVQAGAELFEGGGGRQGQVALLIHTVAQPAGGVADFAGGVAQLGASALQIHKDIGQTAGAEVEPVAHRAHRVGAVQVHTLAEIALGQRGQRIAQRLPVLVSDAHHDHAGNQRGQPA